MSVVVAIKDKGKVYLGADSQSTKGGTRSTLKNENNYKIWNVLNADHCVLASVGAARDACVIRIQEDLIDQYLLHLDCFDYYFVVKTLMPKIISTLREYGYLSDEDEKLTFMDSEFLFVYKDQIFVIDSDFTVFEIDDYVAIGSGSSEAIGSLVSTEGMKPKERIVRAIKASAASDIYVDYPIIITDSDKQKFEVITKDSESKYLSSNNIRKE